MCFHNASILDRISIVNYVHRALDAGTPQQIKDTDLYVTIGDVSRNDGVPEFIAPQVKRFSYVPEPDLLVDVNLRSV